MRNCNYISTNSLFRHTPVYPLNKELAVNFLIETHTKLGELILAAMVLCGLIRELCLSGLLRSLFDGLIGYGITWLQWSANKSVLTPQRLQSQGDVVHYKITCGVFFFFKYMP